MNLAHLKRLAESAEALLKPDRIIVMGSSALLGSFPELGHDGSPVETSKDADLMVTPCSEEDAAVVQEALGEGRAFFRKHGVYVDLLRDEAGALLPKDWERRLMAVDGVDKTFYLDPYDVCVVKLRANREKDGLLISELVNKGLIDWVSLKKRLQETKMAESEIVSTHAFLDRIKTAASDGSLHSRR